MNSSVDDGPDGVTFGPAPAWTWAFVTLGLLALLAAVFADLPGRVLAVALAAAALAAAVADRRASPRLAADHAGVTVGGVAGPRGFTWNEIERIRVDERVRFGRTVHTVEIDAGEALVVAGARSLGADPVTVARRLVALAPPEHRARLGGEILPAPRRRHG